MKSKPEYKPEPVYEIREEHGRFYVYIVRFVQTVETLFDVSSTREDAEQAIADHRAGKHATQWRPE